MKWTALEDAIQHTEEVEDEVLRFLEANSHLVRSQDMLDAVGSLKRALGSLRKVHGSLGSTVSEEPRPIRHDDRASSLRPH
jgi:hypothetical protein